MKKLSKLIRMPLMIFIVLVVLIVGYFAVIEIRRSDQYATIKLTDDVYIKAKLVLKDFPGQSLVIWLRDQDGNSLGNHRIDQTVGGYPIKYVEERNTSWKRVRLVENNSGVMVFDAIWGIIYVDGEQITVKWKNNVATVSNGNICSVSTVSGN